MNAATDTLIQTLAKPKKGNQSWNKEKHKVFLTSEFNLHTTEQMVSGTKEPSSPIT